MSIYRTFQRYTQGILLISVVINIDDPPDILILEFKKEFIRFMCQEAQTSENRFPDIVMEG